jgi:DNA-binding transcriptional regulator YiaG
VTSAEFGEARRKLGLSINQLADILNTNPVTVRRWEMDEERNTARDPNPIACQVLRWLAEGRLRL